MALLTHYEATLDDNLSSVRRSSYGVGEEAEVVKEEARKAYAESTIPYTNLGDIKKFGNLAATWKEATNLKSSLVQISLHPSYQEIIGMGKVVIRLILMELEREPDHWFLALRALTGVDPVNPSERGNIKAMSKAWLKWGKENDYL